MLFISDIQFLGDLPQFQLRTVPDGINGGLRHLEETGNILDLTVLNIKHMENLVMTRLYVMFQCGYAPPTPRYKDRPDILPAR